MPNMYLEVVYNVLTTSRYPVWLVSQASSHVQGNHAFRDRHFAGTVAYAAPEVFQRLRSVSNTEPKAISEYYHKRDIFAMGLVVADLMQGVHPFLHNQLNRSLPIKASVKMAILTAKPYISPECVFVFCFFLVLCVSLELFA